MIIFLITGNHWDIIWIWKIKEKNNTIFTFKIDFKALVIQVWNSKLMKEFKIYG